ncbi:hypothetical protein NPIL_198211 [Nephila pilipes]|uniref:Uncharacterized protein n=1 Tax=Nephila pilipes TaxID=299642 RepID=A0A8X6PKQ5_NEPPI|nr:hypothetical protein NPIL_198211 [Nephila pilipes]
MKRKSSSIDVSSERVCFNDDDDDTKVDSSFSDDAVPLHHFHLGQDIYAAVTYFANAVQIHLRQYGRDDNNSLFPPKRGMNLAKLADRIAEVRASPFTPNVYAVSGRSEQSSDSPHSPLNEMVALRGEIAALSKQVERLS